jgi:hypothetical protein
MTVPKDDLIIVRLGMKREDDYKINEIQTNRKELPKQIQEKIGHSPDVFTYINHAYSIINSIK